MKDRCFLKKHEKMHVYMFNNWSFWSSFAWAFLRTWGAAVNLPRSPSLSRGLDNISAELLQKNWVILKLGHESDTMKSSSR